MNAHLLGDRFRKSNIARPDLVDRPLNPTTQLTIHLHRNLAIGDVIIDQHCRVVELVDGDLFL